MNDEQGIATLPAPNVEWPPPPRNKWEREYRAFRRLLPQLLQTHRGTYVALHDEQVIDCDVDEMVLILRVLAKVGNVDIHVGLVTEQPEPVYRSGVVREWSLAPEGQGFQVVNSRKNAQFVAAFARTRGAASPRSGERGYKTR